MKKTVLLTGATGFLGKVVLEELLRRSDELEIDRIHLLIRPSRDLRAEERFERLRQSRCFSRLTPGWEDRIAVHAGDLRDTRAGLADSVADDLQKQLTHIIHCAASVEFDLPLKLAAEANITSALNVLDLAGRCTRLESMVHVSTAYVTSMSEPGRPITEALVPLSRPAAAIYGSILSGEANEKELLAANGYPNTYTLTKCVAEHLIQERRGSIPLTIVRPSIISAAWKMPFPGWIDSLDAYAGFVAAVGLGHLKVLRVRPSALADIIPVDEVSHRVVRSAFSPSARGEALRIRHATVGLDNATSTGDHHLLITEYFRDRPLHGEPGVRHCGQMSLAYRAAELRHHEIPFRMAELGQRLRGRRRAGNRVAQMRGRLRQLNDGFSYFTHHTFDFRSSMPFQDPDFDGREYVRTICRGVEEFFFKRNPREHRLLGSPDRMSPRGAGWIARNPGASASVRATAMAVRGTGARCVSEVTFDRESFDGLHLPEGRPVVLVPSHRSYGDFLLWSYLFFTHPELGIRLPRIVAAEEFSKIPVVGRILKACGAFYIRRGLGKEDPTLSLRIRELVDSGETLQFFIEGQRSRSGQFLAPRRGVLRALHATGRPVTILPLAISYDRVPEESALLREARVGDKAPMGFRRILRWMGSASRGKIALGRIHLAAGRPLTLESSTNVERLGLEIMAELQSATTVSTHHLAAFVARHPAVPFDQYWLRQQIEARGGRVLDSGLPVSEAAKVSADSERQMRYGWEHWFYADALDQYAGHPIVRHHVVRNGYRTARPRTFIPPERDPRTQALLRMLVEPVIQDYRRVASLAGRLLKLGGKLTVRDLSTRDVGLHPATAGDALAALVGRYILEPSANGRAWSRGAHWSALKDFETGCAPGPRASATRRTGASEGAENESKKVSRNRGHGVSRPAPAPGPLH